MSVAGEWRRLHPVSPVVRGGAGLVAIVVVLLPSIPRGFHHFTDALFQLAAVGVLTLLAGVSWFVTRFRIDQDDLQIETGLFRRQSLRFPLSQVQAIDVVQPGIARLFGVAELRLRMGGASGAHARLAYLPLREVEALREELLELGRGEAVAEDAPEQPAEERVLASVPPGRLAASILISDVGLWAETVIAALVVTLVFAPGAAHTAAASGGTVWVFSFLVAVWRRFNQEYRMTVAEAPDGLRVRAGLVALSAETIRPGRVQAVRMVEPFLWRPLGWCRLQVVVAGREHGKGEGRTESREVRILLPVGSRAVARELLERIVADAPREQLPPPRRVLLKSPLRYRALGWARTDRCVAARSGRLRPVTSWVPLEKVQSLRRVQGPLQRRLKLASVHVDAAGRGMHAILRDRDVEEADRALGELVDLARAARRRAVT